MKNAGSVAVLLSGGLDSAILTDRLAEEYRRVFPGYVGCGIVWEKAEVITAPAKSGADWRKQ